MSYRPGLALVCSKTGWRPWGRGPKGKKGAPTTLLPFFPRVAPLGRCETIQRDKSLENSPFWTRIKIKDLSGEGRMQHRQGGVTGA